MPEAHSLALHAPFRLNLVLFPRVNDPSTLTEPSENRDSWLPGSIIGRSE